MRHRGITKRRGSALVYTSVLMVAITTVVVGTVQLNLTASDKAERRIDDAKADETFNAQVAMVTSLCKSNAITLPHAFTCTLNGITLSGSVTDNGAALNRTYRVDATGTGARPRAYRRVVGGRQMTHPFYYALWVSKGLDVSSTGLSTSGGGSVYIDGNLTLNNTSSIAGDVYAKGSIVEGGANVDRNLSPWAPAQTMPKPSLAALKAEATSLISLPVLTSLSFTSLLVNGHYALHYHDQATTISGLVGGKGTAVFEKKVTVTGNVAYASPTARAVFIVDGDLIVNSGVTRLDGLWYVTGDVSILGTGTLNNTRGSIVCGGTLNTTKALNITMEPQFWTARLEAQRHVVPGFWPSAPADLMR